MLTCPATYFDFFDVDLDLGSFRVVVRIIIEESA